MIKYFLVILFFSFLYGQDNSNKENTKNVKIRKNKIQNFQIDYLVNKVRVDIKDKVSKGIIEDRIAIVELSYSDSISFDSYALSYLMVSLESLRFPNEQVSLIRSIDALSLRGYEVDDKLVIKRGVISNDEMKSFVGDLGAKYYARISFFLEDGYLLLVLSIYDIENHSMIYKSSYANYYKDWSLTFSYSSYFRQGFSQFIPGASIFVRKNILNQVGLGVGSGIYLLSSPVRVSSFSVFVELDFFILNYLGIYIKGFEFSPVFNFETQFLFVENKDKLFLGSGFRISILDFINILFEVSYNFIEILNIQPQDNTFNLDSSSSSDQKLEFKVNTGINLRF